MSKNDTDVKLEAFAAYLLYWHKGNFTRSVIWLSNEYHYLGSTNANKIARHLVRWWNASL